MRLFRGTVHLVTLPGVGVSRLLERWAITRLTGQQSHSSSRALFVASLPFLIATTASIATIYAAFMVGQSLAASPTPQPAGLVAFLSLSWVGLSVAARAFPSSKLTAVIRDQVISSESEPSTGAKYAEYAVRLPSYSRYIGVPVVYAITLFGIVYLEVTASFLPF